MKNNYHPPQKILQKYADVMINFALGNGRGIKKGDVVYITIDEYAKPFFIELRKAVWKAGGHVIANYKPSCDERFNTEKDFYVYAKNHQLEFFPSNYLRGLIDDIDHSIFVISETDKKALSIIDPKKIITRNKSLKPWIQWREAKERAGKFSWTICLYGTPDMAKEAGISLKSYWNEIINACYLNNKQPIKFWKSTYIALNKYKNKLNSMPIDRMHIKGESVDLWIKLGEKRKWLSGDGANIPSFEIFTSPDWRGTNGWIKFNQPLYSHGNIIEGIELEFKNGIIVKSKAKKNYNLLKNMIAVEGANRVGEISMTDGRFSHIKKFMAETLYDENVGGPNGNCHIAIGRSFHEAYAGNVKKVSLNKLKDLGFNDSIIHTDIITTAPRVITAYLKNGKQRVIYKNGQYTF